MLVVETSDITMVDFLAFCIQLINSIAGTNNPPYTIPEKSVDTQSHDITIEPILIRKCNIPVLANTIDAVEEDIVVCLPF